MGWKRERIRRRVALLCAALMISCAPIEDAPDGSDPEIEDQANEDALALLAPMVSGFSPTSATQGTAVMIDGANFGTGVAVSFNGTSARTQRVSSRQLKVTVPTGATTGPISVTTPGGSVTASSFTVLAKVTKISPNRVYPGETVTLTGTGFTGATGVRFGSVAARTFSVLSDTSLTVVFPKGGDTGKVTVVKPEGSSTSAATLSRVFGIKTFSPQSGLEGSTVTLTGGGFTGASSVLFGKTASTFTVVDDATIEAIVPSQAPGASYLTVVVGTAKRTSSTSFAVMRPPSVTSFKPISGSLPVTVYISGRSLASVTSVAIGDKPITTFRSLNDQIIEVQVPASVGTITAPFTLTNSEGTTTTRASFAGVDLCEGVVCGGADQCHGNATCDQATGLCGAPPALADGTACNDANACTQSDSCQAGVCEGANPVVCTALDQCHDAGSCDPLTGACENPAKADGSACNDANACTQTDSCQAGTCAGSDPVVCGGADDCHDAGSCNPETGVCSAPVQTGECNTTPPVVSTNALGAGNYHTCQVRTDGTLNCWGANWYGQTGSGTATSYAGQGTVPNLTGVVAVDGGEGHTCALHASGEVSCWGYNYAGQTGIPGYSEYNPTPGLVPNVSDAIAIAAGGHHTCALRATGDVVCWGANWTGQLGDGGQTPTYYYYYGQTTALATVSGLSNIVSISAGYEHTCAVDSAGAVYCWGRGYEGELGDGSSNMSYTPVQVAGISDAKEVSLGYYSSCALRTNGEVSCWGYGGEGQLGNGSWNYAEYTPVTVQGITDAVGLTNGAHHACALRATGDLVCWGRGYEGELGDGNLYYSSATPVSVSSLSNVIAVAAGYYHTCAADDSGQIYCWGQGGNGQLGSGSWQSDTATPTLLPDCSQGADSDGDLSVDACDADDDNDYLNDTDEANYGTDPLKADTDEDGLSDYDEVNRQWYSYYCNYWYYYYEWYCKNYTNPTNPDTDGDGLTDGVEVYTYYSYPNASDSDSDGLSDTDEISRGTSLTNADSDSDGLNDGQEVLTYGSDPFVPDSDGDGLNDGSEVSAGTSPMNTDTDGDGMNDYDEYYYDADGDGMYGYQEAQYGTNANDADSDDDGLTDRQEVFEYGTNANQADGDGDGLTDGQELMTYHTNVWSYDSDSDGLSDGQEVNTYGTSPSDYDSDGDDMSDGQEVQNGTNPNQVTDSDEDGLSDSDELNSFNTSPTNADSDGDGINDLADLLGLTDNNATTTVAGTDCEDIIVNGGATTDGYYLVDGDGEGGKAAHVVYCDMNADTISGYTYLKVTRSYNVDATAAEAYCARRGMMLFVPRTQAHLSSAFQVAMNPSLSQGGGYGYLFIMGIYPKWSGAVCYNTALRSDNPSCNWRANDNGRFWVTDATHISEPNGDNNPGASMGYNFNSDGTVSWYNDLWSSYTSSQFLCGVSE